MESITARNLSTTDQELLELYEQRYKPAILAAAETNAETSTNYSYLLQAEGLSVIEADADAAFSEAGERPLYLATPTGQGGTEGIDLAAASDASGSAIPEEEQDAEPDSCPLLTEGDHELLDGVRQAGHAATLAEISSRADASMERLTGGDHPDNGVAFLRDYRGRTLMALGSATTADLEGAANREEADAIGAAFEAMTSRVQAIHRTFVGRLLHLGGSSSLTAAVGSLVALGHPATAIRAVIAESHRAGEVRISARGASPRPGQRDRRTRFVTLTGSGEGSLAKAAKRYAEDQNEIPARRKAAADHLKARGQDKAFPATFVPFGGTKVDPVEQRRALYVEAKKARYKDSSGNPIGPRGVSEVTLTLPAFRGPDGKEYPEEHHTLYSAAAETDSPEEFFRGRIRGRILNGLHKTGSLTARTIISTLFPKRAGEILDFLAEGRTMSPQLAAPYHLFRAAARELIEDGTVRHTGKAFVLADPSESKLPTAAELAAEHQVSEWADEDPEPERASGPDPHGSDKYAADQPGAHDSRAIATGPQAPSSRPRKRRRTAGELSAIRESKDPDAATANAGRANLKAAANRAWRDALAVHMDALDEAERLELHLQIHGPRRFERMLEAASEPDAVFRAARALYEEGRITAEKGERHTLIAAATGHDREALSRALLRIMARDEVAVPKGTRLERRVRATRSALTREANASGHASDESAA